MPMSPPRMLCMSRSERPRISLPAKRTLPVIDALASRTSPSMEYMATLLPDPDSPTMPTTSFWPTWSERPSTALTSPWRVANETFRSSTVSTASLAGVKLTDNAHPRIQVGVENVNDRARQDDKERSVHD